MNHIYDTKALELSRQVMAIMYGPMPAGGSVQLQAKIQNLFIEAMQFAEQKVPAGYVLVPVKPTQEMVWAAKSVLKHTVGWDSFVELYKTMLSAAPVASDGWIPVSEQLPEESGRYWCYVEEQNSLGKSHYQWNCSWNGDGWSDSALTGRVTHWQPLPDAPKGV